MVNLPYLLLSVTLSAGRNIASKKTACDTNVEAQFFLRQTILFVTATFLGLFLCIKDFPGISVVTFGYGVIYGVFLILSQWMFTLALKIGNTSVCSVVYSLGFILPTVLGTVLWNETMSLFNFIGILVAIIIILLTSKKGESATKSKKSFIPYILIAMISSGGLGIMQKVQQSSKAANEKSVFLFVAFAVAFCCSFVAFLISREKLVFNVKGVLYPTFTGLCFGGANFCNTILAGKMKSAVLFPLQNISTIFLTTLLGIFLFKEKLTIKTAVILMLGIGVIVLFSI